VTAQCGIGCSRDGGGSNGSLGCNRKNFSRRGCQESVGNDAGEAAAVVTVAAAVRAATQAAVEAAAVQR
jgi:hypothetical protein